MAKAAAKAAPEPQLSLADQIRAAQQAAEELIAAKVQELKVAHPTLPVGWLEMDLRHRMKGGACDCKCALALLEKEK